MVWVLPQFSILIYFKSYLFLHGSQKIVVRNNLSIPLPPPSLVFSYNKLISSTRVFENITPKPSPRQEKLLFAAAQLKRWHINIALSFINIKDFISAT